MAAKVISLINLRGGVGKSTLAMIIAEYMAFKYEKKVLLIDTDAQANLTAAMVHQRNIQNLDRDGQTIFHFYQTVLKNAPESIDRFICPQGNLVSNIERAFSDIKLDMVIAVPSLAQLDEVLLDHWERGQPPPSGLRLSLKYGLSPVLERYDVVIIDCPPGLSLFTSSALAAADLFVAPAIPESLSTLGIHLLKDRTGTLKIGFQR